MLLPVHGCYLDDELVQARRRGTVWCRVYYPTLERALRLFRGVYPEEVVACQTYWTSASSAEEAVFHRAWLNKGYRFLAVRGEKLYILAVHDGAVSLWVVQPALPFLRSWLGVTPMCGPEKWRAQKWEELPVPFDNDARLLALAELVREAYDRYR